MEVAAQADAPIDGDDVPKPDAAESTKKKRPGILVDPQYITDMQKRKACLGKRKPCFIRKAYELAVLTGLDLLVVMRSRDQPSQNRGRRTDARSDVHGLQVMMYGQFAQLSETPEMQNMLAKVTELSTAAPTTSMSTFAQSLEQLVEKDHNYRMVHFERACLEREREHERMLERMSAQQSSKKAASRNGKKKTMSTSEALDLLCDEIENREDGNFEDILYGGGGDQSESDDEDQVESLLNELEELEESTLVGNKRKRNGAAEPVKIARFDEGLPDDYASEADSASDASSEDDESESDGESPEACESEQAENED